MVAYAAFKGAVLATVTFAIGTTFGQSLLIAVVSGGLGLLGMLGAAFISTRAARQNKELLHDIKGKVGADRRAEDDTS